jgi:serine-type D-Ala-D-Ala carboxypeptidase
VPNPSPEITTFLQERIDANDFPSAVYLVAEKGSIVFADALGQAVVEPERIQAKLDTIYDLASLTKPLVVGLLSAQLAASGQIDLNDPVGRYLPEFSVSDKAQISLRHLIDHTSGFAAWKPFYLLVDRPDAITEYIASVPLDHETGKKVVYSDANFIILGRIIEKVNSARLDSIFQDELVNHLDLRSTAFRPVQVERPNIAASEKGNMYERQSCVDQGYLSGTLSSSKASIPSRSNSGMFRSDVIWGEVHDGNAYFMGGVAGHAGLFSTIEEVFTIALQFLSNFSTVLSPQTCDLFRFNMTPRMNEHRSFAFQLASTLESTAGTRMSSESFGHLGFTGTSLWIDPVKERIFVLLTNRTHHHPLPFVNINFVRRRFHDLAISSLAKIPSN